MTVYVDRARIVTTRHGVFGLWSWLTADDPAEMHALARRVGVDPSWYVDRCARCTADERRCWHWHYDVNEWMRVQALTSGAADVDTHRMGELLAARRAALARVKGPRRRIRRTGYGPCPLRPYAPDHTYRESPGRGMRCACGNGSVRLQ